MERWDFDCQKCGCNIGDAYYVDAIWYQCSQEANKYKTLKSAYPTFTFNKNGDITGGQYPDKEDLNGIIKSIKSDIEYGYVISGNRNIAYEIDYKHHKVIWHTRNEDEYYKKVGIKKHEIKGSGRGRVGYCFCINCTKNLNYKCPVCDSKLIKIEAKDHPGGDGWGIRGVREPSPMGW